MASRGATSARNATGKGARARVFPRRGRAVALASGVAAFFVVLVLVLGIAGGLGSARAAPQAGADREHEGEALRVVLAAPLPASCPALPSLVERVRAHSPRIREAKPGEAARQLRVTVTPSERGFVGALELVDEDETVQRRVPGKTCGEVLSAIALIAALSIDARDVDGGAPAEAGGGRDARVLRPLERWGNERPATADAGDAGHGGVALGFGTSLEIRGLGDAVLAPSFLVEGSLRASELRPALRLTLSRTQSFTESVAGRPASFVLTTASLQGCVTTLEKGPASLRPCLEASGGALRATSAAFGPVTDEVRPWAAVGARGFGRFSLVGPLAIEGSFGFLVPLVRDDFIFRPRAIVYRAPPLVLVGSLGLAVAFP